jgi:hypothetical protein
MPPCPFHGPVGNRAEDRARQDSLTLRIDGKLFQPPVDHQGRSLTARDLVQNQNPALHPCLQTG